MPTVKQLKEFINELQYQLRSLGRNLSKKINSGEKGYFVIKKPVTSVYVKYMKKSFSKLRKSELETIYQEMKDIYETAINQMKFKEEEIKNQEKIKLSQMQKVNLFEKGFEYFIKSKTLTPYSDARIGYQLWGFRMMYIALDYNMEELIKTTGKEIHLGIFNEFDYIQTV